MAFGTLKSGRDFFHTKRFSLPFVLISFILIFKGLALLPDTFLIAFRDVNGAFIALLSNSIGIHARYSAGLLSVSGFDMRFIMECTAVHYTTIFTAAVALYPRYDLRYKLKGIVAGNALIVSANALRLILIGIVGAHNRPLFDFVHDYLWQAVFAVIVFTLWAAWADRSVIDRPRARFTLLFLLISALLLVGFGAVKETYLRFLAYTSDGIIGLLSKGSSLSSASVRLHEGRVVYSHGGVATSVDFWQDVITLVIFLGLMTASLVHSRGWERYSKNSIAAGFAGGAVVLILAHVLDVTAVAMLLRNGVQADITTDYLWIVRGLFMAAPVLLWIVFQGALAAKSSSWLPETAQKSDE